MIHAALLLFVVSTVCAGEAGSMPKHVVVQLFGEAGCPDTTAFIFGPLAAAQKAVGVADVMFFDWIPFGNAYYLTNKCCGVPAPEGCHDSSSCLFNSTVRDCYFEHCGLGAHDRLDDCYGPGQVRCQHGPTECAANRVEACVKMNDPTAYWNTSRCIEKAFYTGALKLGDSEEQVLKQAKACGVDEELLASCYSTAAGNQAVERMAKSTPSHPGVPYVLINNVPLQDTSNFLQAVCKAYTGPVPEGCQATDLIQAPIVL